MDPGYVMDPYSNPFFSRVSDFDLRSETFLQAMKILLIVNLMSGRGPGDDIVEAELPVRTEDGAAAPLRRVHRSSANRGINVQPGSVLISY